MATNPSERGGKTHEATTRGIGQTVASNGVATRDCDGDDGTAKSEGKASKGGCACEEEHLFGTSVCGESWQQSLGCGQDSLTNGRTA